MTDVDITPAECVGGRVTSLKASGGSALPVQ